MKNPQTSSQYLSEGFGPPHDRTRAAAAIGLMLLTLAIYSRVRDYQFISIDDPLYISGNASVSQGLSLEGVRWAFVTNYYSNWIPFTWISFMLDASIYGKWAGGYHSTNVILHIANVLLLFKLLAEMTEKTARAAFVAAMFAVHPLHVESVAWISERKDVLSMFFGLGTLHMYFAYVRAKRNGRRAHAQFYTSIGLYCCSLLSKQLFVTLPFLLLLLDYWPLKRQSEGVQSPLFQSRRDSTRLRVEIAAAPSTHGSRFWRTQLSLIREKLAFLIISLVFCFITFQSQHQGTSVQSLTKFPLDSRLLNAVLAYGLYLRKALLPYDLAAFYPHPGSNINATVVTGVVGMLLGITCLAVVNARKHPYFLVGWLWYLGSLVPMIGIVQVGIQQMADRYAYLPMIGIYLALTWSISQFMERGGVRARHLRRSVSFCVVGIYAVLGYFQVSYWQDGIILLRRSMELTGETPHVCSALGDALLGNNQFEAGIGQYRRATELAPNDPWPRFQLGLAYENLGAFRAAAAAYRETVDIDEKMVAAHIRQGMTLLRIGEYAEAESALKRALHLQPDNAEVHLYLAAGYRATGNYNLSIEHCGKALGFNDRLIECRRLLAANLRDLRRWDEALVQVERVLDSSPHDAAATKQRDELLMIHRHQTLAE